MTNTMQGTKTGSATFTLLLTKPVTAASLAAPILAAHLGITEGRALRRLTSGPGPIASGLEDTVARRLFALLTMFGITLRLRPDNDAALRFDLSVQKAIWADTHVVAEKLALALGREPALIAQALDHPGGLMLCDLGPLQAREMQVRLAPIRGIFVLQGDQDGAIYDLFLPDALTAAQSLRLMSALSPMAARPDPLTGACATDLCPALRDRLFTRLPDLGLLAIDRRFQRFDLYLTGVTGWVTRDLADFLAVRTGQPRALFEVISPSKPLLIDHGLTPAVLRQFRADYAAIGLSTRPLLRGLSRFPENPIL